MSDKDTKPRSAREKIVRLRKAFIGQLPARIEELRTLSESLAGGTVDPTKATELHRVLHNLNGTGRSFRLCDLGDAAAHGERLAASLLDHPERAVQPRWRRQWRNALERLGTEAKAAVETFEREKGNEPPGFILPSDEAKSDRPGGRRLVYVCDDDPMQLDHLTGQLRCFGYQATAFIEPALLREAVQTRRPDALVMDIRFPQGDSVGIDLVQAIANDTGQPVPVVFLSARDDFEARLAAVQAGGEAYFNKPARVTELVTTLDELTFQNEPEPYRVVIVDDDPEIAAYHAIILQEAGMTTCQVGEPAGILPALQELRPDIVLMDMYMPSCSGRDLAKVIRQIPDYVGLPIVYLSGETDTQKQFSAMSIGAEGFLTKPVVPMDLVAAVAIRAERMRTLRSLMARDSLTGLFNHTTTTQLLEKAIATAARSAGQLCFAMIDLDLFKSVNDTYGHPAGDKVIIALTRVLRQRLRASDIVGRYGGEEFAVILEDTTPAQAFALIDDLRRNFSRVVFHAGTTEFSCSFSAGIAGYPKHRRMELLCEAADKALYNAKYGGRNCVVAD